MVFLKRKKIKKGREGLKRGVFKKRKCKFCADKEAAINYKEVSRLQKFITERGKIVPSRISGNCAKHQRQVASAIKQARQIALLPFVKE